MKRKIKINIHGFGKRYHSNYSDLHLSYNREIYIFYKKGTNIKHNEYGPAIEWKDGSYQYFINDKLHSFKYPACFNRELERNYFLVIGKFIGYTKEEVIKEIANTLIPKNKIYL